MPNYCQTIWETYNALNETHKDTVQIFNDTVITQGDLARGRELLDRVQEKLDEMQETWSTCFINLEVNGEETTLFKGDYEAMEELERLNPNLPGEPIINYTRIVSSGRIITISIELQGLEDITPLEKLTELIMLNICGSGVRDLSPLQHLPKLERLLCIASDVDNLQPLLTAPSLKLIDAALCSNLNNPEQETIIQALIRKGVRVNA